MKVDLAYRSFGSCAWSTTGRRLADDWPTSALSNVGQPSIDVTLKVSSNHTNSADPNL